MENDKFTKIDFGIGKSASGGNFNPRLVGNLRRLSQILTKPSLSAKIRQIMCKDWQKKKAEVVAANYSDRMVLGADTTVVLDNQITGKPVDLDDARRMLRLLSGNWHEVLTGVAVVQNGSTKVGLQNTRVKFVELSESAIEFLVKFGEPLDKAGRMQSKVQVASIYRRD